MKKSILITVLAILFTLTINAQTKTKQIFLHDKAVMEELNLTAEQQAKILEIKKLTDPQISAARSNTSYTPEELKKELTKVYSGRTKMQYEVLTAEQIEKLKQMRADAKKGD